MDTKTMRTRIAGCLAAAAMLATNESALAAEAVEWVSTSRPRYEIAIGAHSWPGIADLEFTTDGSFDEVGPNLGFAVHWPVRRFAYSELLAGLDLTMFSNESSVTFISEDVVARNGYLAGSVKWMFGRIHRYSIDAGVGYYLLDIAEVAGDFPDFYETQLWEDSSLGGYIGGTVDFRGGDSAKRHGFMASVKVHFVEFENIRDEDPFAPVTLGQDAGDLSGPVYMIQVGYRWR